MVAELLWQLTGSRTLRNASSQIETAAAAMFDTLLLWQERARQRRVLARLDDHLLFDIGRSREEVARECAKPVWRARRRLCSRIMAARATGAAKVCLDRS